MGSSEVDVAKELKELKNTIQELRSALVEIKAALADLTGPFSMYKPPVEEKRTQVGATLGMPASVEEPTRALELKEEPTKPTPSIEQTKPGREVEEITPILREAQRIIREEGRRLAGVTLKQIINLLKTLYEIRNLYPKSNIDDVINLLEKLSVISSGEADILRTTMNIIENSMRENITPEETIVMAYLILRNVGVREDVLDEELTKLIMQFLSARRGKQKHGESSEKKTSNGGLNEWGSQQQSHTQS